MDDGPDVLTHGDETGRASSRVPWWARRHTLLALVCALGIAAAVYGAHRPHTDQAAEAAPISLAALLLPPDAEAAQQVTPGRTTVPFSLWVRNDGTSPVDVRGMFILASGITLRLAEPRMIGPGGLRLVPLTLHFRCPVTLSYVSDLSVRARGTGDTVRTVDVPFGAGIGYIDRLARRACREPEPRNMLAFRYLGSHVSAGGRAVQAEVRAGNGWTGPVSITEVRSRIPGMRVTASAGSRLPLRVPSGGHVEFTLTWRVDDCRSVPAHTPGLVPQDLTVEMGDGGPEPLEAVPFGDRYVRSILDLARRVCDAR